ncbi:MAG TPA: GNAT family N-acetyltransferase [Streptosporangiaceae bacterium]|jgi:GNAT superfamily N-acetyltransferase
MPAATSDAVEVRSATDADLPAIAAITTATGQEDEWAGANPAYVRHLLAHGRFVVAALAGRVAGFGATEQVGIGAAAVTVLCDLFVDPAAHGQGLGRAMLADLWGSAPRKMTFSSLHSHALPLYTSFGVDAWWPLLYLTGEPAPSPATGGWSATLSDPAEVAAHEHRWTGRDRLADHAAWATRPGGACVEVRRGGEVAAVGTVIGAGAERGIVHLACAPALDDTAASGAVLAALTVVVDGGGQHAHVCLPGPHPAVRTLLAAGWRVREFDLFMSSEPGLLDPRRAVPSPGQA